MPSSNLFSEAQTSRRGFIAGASTLAAAVACPGLLAKGAATRDEPGQTSSTQTLPLPTQSALILLNLRGGADGLSLCIPHAEPKYYAARPNIAIPRPGSGSNAAIDLDGFFGIPPAMAPILPAFQSGRLAIIHAVGSADRHNSHFQAQRELESGMPDAHASMMNWSVRWAQAASTQAPAKAIAIGGPTPLDAAPFLRPAVVEPLAQPGASPLAVAITQALSILASDESTRIVSIDSTGWDTHAHQNARGGALETSMAELAEAIGSFHQRAVVEASLPITLVACTEFGRTTAENAIRGTDHGHASAAFVLGSRVNGGRVFTDWPGLNDADLPATTHIHDVLAEVLAAGLRESHLDAAFPGRAPKFQGIMLS